MFYNSFHIFNPRKEEDTYGSHEMEEDSHKR